MGLPATPASTQHAAGLGLANELVRIRLEQEAGSHRAFGGAAHGGDVAFVAAVALFQRGARVATRLAFGRRAGEGHHAAHVVADLVLVEGPRTASGDVPAEIGAQWSV